MVVESIPVLYNFENNVKHIYKNNSLYQMPVFFLEDTFTVKKNTALKKQKKDGVPHLIENPNVIFMYVLSYLFVFLSECSTQQLSRQHPLLVL